MGKAIRDTSTSGKIFVLDTSVIIHDHEAFKNFQEHDVAIPIQVLEELDNFKNGNDTRNFEARSFIRLMDELSGTKPVNEWLALPGSGHGKFKVVMDENHRKIDAEKIFGSSKVDHGILNAALALKEEHPEKKVILVSKDICLRLKAKALDLHAEDYATGKIKNARDLYTGKTSVDKPAEKNLKEFITAGTIPAEKLEISVSSNNHFYLFNNKRTTISAFYSSKDHVLYYVPEDEVHGIKPKSPEQACALYALLHPDIKLVTLQGNAGTGKTLLALASALQQRKNYRQIYITRPIVPLSNKDIGFLPGDVKSKVDPYMAPIWDNLKFIKEQQLDIKARNRIDELVETDKISIAPLAFIRGRTLTKIFFIVDEAQNLTPHEVKTIISRAGENTKIVFTGDIYQIDTPYLDSESNGLSYLIDKAKNHPLYAHITLQKGERSELANLATELL